MDVQKIGAYPRFCKCAISECKKIEADGIPLVCLEDGVVVPADEQKAFSSMLAQHLYFYGLPALIEDYLEKNYPELDEQERLYLNPMIHRRMKAKGEWSEEYLQETFHQCLQICAQLHFEGFVEFRLKDKLARIESSLQAIVWQMEQKRADRELIRKLSLMMPAERETGMELKLTFYPGGAMLLTDLQERRVWVPEDQEMQAKQLGLKDEDILLCVLVVVNPAYLHLRGKIDDCTQRIAQCVMELFQGRCNNLQ